MRLSDALKSKRAKHLEAMTALTELAAKDGRNFTDAERGAFDADDAAIKAIDSDIARASAVEAAARGERPANSTQVAVDDQGNEHRVFRAADRLADRHRNGPLGGARVTPAQVLRGIITGRWDGVPEAVRRAMGEATLPGGGFTVPAELAAQWLDMARSASVCVALGAGTIPMGSQTLRVAELKSDFVPGFRPEGVAFPSNDLLFGAVDLRARTLGVVGKASMELLADSPIANEMIAASLLASMGLAMDQAALSGDGVVDATHDNPTGLLVKAGVTDVPAAAVVNYDPIMDAMTAIANANGSATGMAWNPTDAAIFGKLKTGLASDETTLVPPGDVAALTKKQTTGIVAGKALVGQWDQLAFAMREGIVIQATELNADDFGKGMVSIRAVARMDVAIWRPTFFAKLTGITAAP